jgi:uncharacterized protein (TIGR03437 family)
MMLRIRQSLENSIVRAAAHLKATFLISPLLASIAFAQTAAPAITDVVDAGSYTPAVAPGSLLVVKGTNLCGSTAQASAPYQTAALAGVTIQFTAAGGGSPVPAFMESTYCAQGLTQVAAVAPSSLAPGAYNVTVTNKGSASAPFPTTVTATKFGIMTLPGSGSGRALVQNVVSSSRYDLNGFTTGPVAGANYQRSPAIPGEYLIIWGMGLGAAAGYDSSAPASGLDFLPQGLIVQVIVGGMRITPTYAGRSNLFAGLDNIVFQLPANVPTGCDVSLQVRAGGGGGGGGGGQGHLGNVTTIAIAPAGAAACVSPMLSTNALTRLDQGQTITEGTFLFAGPPGGNRPFVVGQFAKFSGDQLSQASIFFTAPGTCRVAASNTTGLPSGLGVLDAGTVTLNGPGIANFAVPQLPDKTYSFNFSGDQVTSGSTYTLSGAGGKDVGAFSATGVIDSPITATSVTPTNIPRNQDLTITWTGGTGTDFITIYGAASAPIDANTPNTAVFTCTTTVDKGTITVPSSILAQLPATPANPNAANLLIGFWFRAPNSTSSLFTAPLTGGGSTDAAIFIAALGGGADPAFYQ